MAGRKSPSTPTIANTSGTKTQSSISRNCLKPDLAGRSARRETNNEASSSLAPGCPPARRLANFCDFLSIPHTLPPSFEPAHYINNVNFGECYKFLGANETQPDDDGIPDASLASLYRLWLFGCIFFSFCLLQLRGLAVCQPFAPFLAFFHTSH